MNVTVLPAVAAPVLFAFAAGASGDWTNPSPSVRRRVRIIAQAGGGGRTG
jgi:hypothetical protein